jgi:hypothetical protein
MTSRAPLIDRDPEAAFVATPPRARAIVRPVFVGREAELQVLEQELANATAGEGRVVLVVGEEGIGKTSLALELTRRARGRAIPVLWGRCHEAGGVPAFWPWIQVLRRYLETADPAALRDDLGEHAAILAWILPAFRERCRDVPAADPAELTRFHVVDAVTQLLKRAAARRPLLVVVDDLHRADGDAFHLFRFLARESLDAPLLLVGAHRDGVGGPRAAELADLAGQPLTSALRLEGFAVVEVRHYIEQSTTVRPSEGLAGAIHAKTGGNPLFVAEVAGLLATDGTLADPATSGFRVAIPETRRQAITTRLERLSPHAQRLLGIAAVIGSDFGRDTIAAVAGEATAVVQCALDEAVDARMVSPSDDEPGTYRFSHVLVRDALYGTLDPRTRADFHADVARALEATARSGAAMESAFAAIAHHYLQAATDDDGKRRAVEWLSEGGTRASRMMAHDEAARYFEAALGIAEQPGLLSPARTSSLVLALAEARWRAGDLAAARAMGRRALALAKDVGEPAAIAAAALAFAGRLPGFGAIVSDPDVVVELEEALALLPISMTDLRARVMARLAEELAYAPGVGAERTLGQQAIELARGAGDAAVLADVLRTVHWSVWTPDAVERRRRLSPEIVALAARTGDRVLALDGELLALWSALEHGETDVAWRHLALCARMAHELRLPHYVWVTAAARACLHFANGRLDEAERLAEQASEIGAHTGNPTVALFAGGQRMHVKSLRGHLEEVAAWLQDVLTTFPVLATAMECALITTFATAEQHDRVRLELAAYAADDFARVPRTPAWLMNMVFLAHACTAIADGETAHHLYRHLAPFTPYNVVVPPAYVLAPVSHYVAGLAIVMGKERAARRHYDDALALERRTGTRHWTAVTQIDYGRLLVRASDPADVARGLQLLAAGRSIAKELGMEPAIRDADAALPRFPAAESPRGVFRHVGDGWQLEFRGRAATVGHRVGMTYLRCLLERPGVAVPALELAALGGESVLVDGAGRRPVDRRAVTEVQRRLAEIDAEIASGERRGSTAGAALLHERRECAAYLARRSSELVSASDRARSCVTKAIGRALKTIRDVHEGLAHHLERHVETGRLCVYVPDPATPVTFEL